VDEGVRKLVCRECGYDVTGLADEAGVLVCPECGEDNIPGDRVAAPLEHPARWPNPLTLAGTLLAPTLVFGSFFVMLAAIGGWIFLLLNWTMWLIAVVGWVAFEPRELVVTRAPRRHRRGPLVGLVLLTIVLNVGVALVLLALVAALVSA